MTRDDGYTRYTVRIPTPLYERVKTAAGEASVNSLLVRWLLLRADDLIVIYRVADTEISNIVPARIRDTSASKTRTRRTVTPKVALRGN